MCGVLGFNGSLPSNTALNWSAAPATIEHRRPNAIGSCMASIGQTCNYLPDKGFDERSFIAAIVESCGISSDTICPDSKELFADLPKLRNLHDDPLPYPSVLAKNAVVVY